MQLKERSRYAIINPDKGEKKKEGKTAEKDNDSEADFTDGFYTSDIDSDELRGVNDNEARFGTVSLS